MTDAAATANSESTNNTYPEPAFEGTIKTDTFRLPIDPAQTAIVAPEGVIEVARSLQRDLKDCYGRELAILPADEWNLDTAGKRHWILVGTIESNPWLLDLYGQRRFLCDALFPGRGGFAIQSVRSPWAPERFCLTITGNDATATEAAVRWVAGQLPDEPVLTPIRRVQGEAVKRVLASPKSARAALDKFKSTRLDLRPPYPWFAYWGVLYYLTGDREYADCLREAYAHVMQRGEQSGKWVSEPWTNVHFLLWQIVMAWELVECDPCFTEEDRRRITHVLWAWAHFVDGMSYLKPEWCVPGELRQNHTTFSALGLHYAHRYFTTRYGLTDLDHLAETAERCFAGQSTSYRPNDDAAHYLMYSPLDTIAYRIRRRDKMWIDEGRLATLADVVVATTDNLRNRAPWGDVGGFHRFKPTDPHNNATRALAMAAFHCRDGAARRAFDWLGAERRPTLRTVIEGMYATNIKPTSAERFLGVRAYALDDSAVRWVAARSATDTATPDRSQRYLDKLSMRRDFDPQSEYLMLEGTSTFSHGHLDGNTIASLTWRDRQWLFDMDYIRAAPREHNGVEIARDGLQRSIPSLTRIDWAVDFADAGMVRTSVADYNGADWQRTILWHKGKHFIVHDAVTPRAPGDYRATIRLRTKGKVALDDNRLTVEQDGERFCIDSGDASTKSIARERDGSHANWSQYPHDDGATVVYRGEYTGARSVGSRLAFVHALYPGEPSAGVMRSGAGGFYWDSRAGRQAGSADVGMLHVIGLQSDATYWWATENKLYLADATSLTHADRSISLSAPAAWSFARASGNVRMVVDRPTRYACEGCRIANADGAVLAPEGTLSPGAYEADLGTPAECAALLAHMAQRTLRPRPPAPSRPVAFGWTVEERGQLPDEPAARATAWGNGSRPGELLIGTARGEVWTAGVDAQPGRIATLPEGAPVRFVGSKELRSGSSDAETVIIAGDERAKVSCLSPQGEVKWSADLEGNHPRPAIVTSLAVAPIGEAGEPALLFGTEAWNVFAFTPAGKKLWRSFVRYHAITAVRPFELRPGQWRIAVGTEYHTPLNVLDASGEPEWFTWEQVGSESRSTTDYFGYGLTQMLAHDLDADGTNELVFGTEANTLAAVRGTDGQTVWSVPVADKVVALSVVETRRGGRAFLTILADGTLLQIAQDGNVQSHTRLDGCITRAARIRDAEWHVVAFEHGSVALIDADAKIRAVHEIKDGPIAWLSPFAQRNGVGVTVATERHIHRLVHRLRSGRASRHF